MDLAVMIFKVASVPYSQQNVISFECEALSLTFISFSFIVQTLPVVLCPSFIAQIHILDNNQEITLQSEWNRTLTRRRSEEN